MKESIKKIYEILSQVEPIDPAFSVPKSNPAYPIHYNPNFLALVLPESVVPHFCVGGSHNEK